MPLPPGVFLTTGDIHTAYTGTIRFDGSAPRALTQATHIEAHRLNVIKVGDDALEAPAAIITQVWTRWGSTRTKAIGEKLVDCPISPLLQGNERPVRHRGVFYIVPAAPLQMLPSQWRQTT